MVLFGADKKETTGRKKIRPVVVKTQNVARELMLAARSSEVEVEDLDFFILDTQTYVRMDQEGVEVEWEEISSDAVYDLDAKTTMLNGDFEIKQIYEIEIFGKNDFDKYKDFHVAVGANATKCKIYLSIKEGSTITYSPTIIPDLAMLINKSKIRAGILINIFDDMLPDLLSKLSARVRVAENLVFNKTETLLIAKGFEPTITQDDKLIFHYDKNEIVPENKKIDYSKRGFIQSVYKDELLIEYLNPVMGQAGRNCRGEFMEPKPISTLNVPKFGIDSTIKEIKTNKGIEYRAVQNGYIAFDKNIYSIQTYIDVDQVSFKTTGSISSPFDSDISLNVKELDAQKDAVGTGMEVNVAIIDIEGNVGPNAKVNAKKAIIGGQTHKTSVVSATNLNIHVHKGRAYGEHIYIARLEHGIVEGDKINIAQAMGGEIKGKEIKIEVCGSYVKASASHLIEITRLHSGENIFTIDPLLGKIFQDDTNENQEDIEQFQNDIKEIERDIAKYTQVILGNQATFDIIKKKLIHYKKNNIKMPPSFVEQYNKFVKIEKHLIGLKSEKKLLNNKISLLGAKTAAFQDNILNARIINRGAWIGHNEIKFKLIKPEIELVYRPRDGSNEHIFGLVEVEEGDFEIQALKS